MYLSRTGSPLDLALWLLMSGLWSLGGWLISWHLFRARQHKSGGGEMLFGGLAVGWLLFILGSNLLAQVMPLEIACWGAAAAVLALGGWAAWRSPRRPHFPLHEILAWKQILAFLGLLLLFALINRGLAIFDENNNLPLVSLVAAGDIPPHYYLNPTQYLDYHYGLHLFAASLVRTGGLHAWSAFDLSRAFAIALSVLLGWLWLRRFISPDRHGQALLAGCLLFLFAGGARWLLLFLPEAALQSWSAHIDLWGSAQVTGADLSAALVSAWKIEGGGPFPFPFAFVNGIFPPISLALTGSGAMPQLTIFLLLLLARRRWNPLAGLIYGLVLTSLALTAEHLFVMAWGGLALAVCLGAWLRRADPKSRRAALSWGWVLAPGALLAPIMGGVLTETLRRAFSAGPSLAQNASQGEAGRGIGFGGAGLRWPPAVVSAHLGELSIFDPVQALVGLLELGAVILLAPWVTRLSWRQMRQGKWGRAGLGFAALVSFILPPFITLVNRDRDISRLSGSALFIWLALGIPYLWLAYRKGSPRLRLALASAALIAMIGGLAVFPVQMIAAARTQMTYFVQPPDAQISRAYWNRLEVDAWVLDLSNPSRAATLFGRSAGEAFEDIYTPQPEYASLLKNPDALRAAQLGYAYIYVDRDAWQLLTPEQRQGLRIACVEQIAEQKTDLGDFRRLLDIQKCQKTP